jgi:hypothetical protein
MREPWQGNVHPGALLSFKSPEKLNMEKSMEMSFFISCPLRNALAGPDTSGHRPPCHIIVTSALRVCPDVRGTLRPLVMGHEIKKDISILP